MKPKIKIPLYDIRINQRAKSEVAKLLESGWLSPGKYVQQFEQAVKKMWNIPYAATVGSATDGMIMALMASGVGNGDEVITTPFTFVATYEAILAVGAKPVVADIDRHSLTLSPSEVSKKITKKTKAIIPVDIAGYSADYTALNKICRKHDLKLISDSAHSIGTRYKNKSIAHYTTASIISFHATKNLICGEGGMVLSKNKKLIETVKLLSSHGLTKTAFNRKKSHVNNYDVLLCGMKGNMSEMHAALGCGQLATFDKEQKARKTVCKRYHKNLSVLSEFIDLPPVSKNVADGHHLYIIKLNLDCLKINRSQFVKQLLSNGIETGYHYQPIFDFTYYKKQLKLNAKNYPTTAKIAQRVVTLPLYPHLKLTEVDYICDKIKKILISHK